MLDWSPSMITGTRPWPWMPRMLTSKPLPTRGSPAVTPATPLTMSPLEVPRKRSVRAVERGDGTDAAIAVEQACLVAARATVDAVAGHAERVGDDHAAVGLHRHRRFQGHCIGTDPAHCQATALQQLLQRLAGRHAAADRTRRHPSGQSGRVHDLHAGLAHVAAQRFFQWLRLDVEALYGGVVGSVALCQRGRRGTGQAAASKAMHRRDGRSTRPGRWESNMEEPVR